MRCASRVRIEHEQERRDAKAELRERLLKIEKQGRGCRLSAFINFVFPAKAGTQGISTISSWIPAFARTTGWKSNLLKLKAES
jgi:hypothetical protein